MFAVFLHGKAIYSVSLATCLCLDYGSHDAGLMMSMTVGSKWFSKAHVMCGNNHHEDQGSMTERMRTLKTAVLANESEMHIYNSIYMNSSHLMMSTLHGCLFVIPYCNQH